MINHILYCIFNKKFTNIYTKFANYDQVSEKNITLYSL